MKSGIYQIINNLTNKIYIGSSINILNRFAQHKRKLNNNKHNNKFQSDWNFYTECNFTFKVIEYTDNSNLLIREQFYLNSLLFANLNDKRFNVVIY